MYLCKVAGKVVCTIKLPSLKSGSLIFVKPIREDDMPGQELMVAYDCIGCGEGDVVLVTRGANARFAHSLQDVPIDLAVVGIVDNYELAKAPAKAATKAAGRAPAKTAAKAPATKKPQAKKGK